MFALSKHVSLKTEKKPVPTLPKPLVSKEELTDIARKALREQVEKRIRELAVEQTSMEQIVAELTRMRETLEANMAKLSVNVGLEKEVLEKLKVKLDGGR